jgi:hypothetical protein
VAAHCDSNVLHAPKECEYCDEYPELQLARIQQRVNFTGHYQEGWSLCPAEQRRTLDQINRWYGNAPMDEKHKQEQEAYWQEVERLLKKEMES